MKKEIADAWVARLRSLPADKQCRNALGRVNGTRCSLGVLADIAVEQNVISDPIYPISPSETRLIYGDLCDAGVGTLPRGVRDWAGMETSDGQFVPEDYNGRPLDAPCITSLNDELYLTFNEIADVIEKHWEKL